MYINSDLQPVLNKALNRQWSNEGTVNTALSGYNGMKIVYVVPSRFYSAIEMNSGAENWGFSKGADAKSLNFMIIYPDAVLQVQKFAMPKIFTPDENQAKDAWKFQFRLYHDCFVYDNKANGIFAHIANN